MMDETCQCPDCQEAPPVPHMLHIVEVDERGFIISKTLGDGRLVAVTPLLLNRANLCITKLGEDPAEGFWEDTWDYDSPMAALRAFVDWEPEMQKEPSGWMRHPQSHRRRPNGDPALEYVRE